MEDQDYITNTYNALKLKVQGFDKTEEQYRELITSDSGYRENVRNALTQKVEGFSRTTEEFDSLIGVKKKDTGGTPADIFKPGGGESGYRTPSEEEPVKGPVTEVLPEDESVNRILSKATQLLPDKPVPQPRPELKEEDTRIKFNQPIIDRTKIDLEKGMPDQSKKQIAFEYSQKGDYAVSDQILNSIDDDKDGYVYELKAHNLLAQGDIEGAKEYIQTAINRQPNNVRLYTELADIAVRGKDAKTALEAADKYIYETGGIANGKEDIAVGLSAMYELKGDEKKSEYWKLAAEQIHENQSKQNLVETLKTFPDWFLSMNPLTMPVGGAIEGIKEISQAKSFPAVLSGVMSTGFAALGYTPTLFAYNLALQPDQMYNSGQISQLLFQPITTVMQIDHEKLSDWGKLGLDVADLAMFGFMLKKATAGIEGAWRGKELYDKHVNGEPLTGAEVKEVAETLEQTPPQVIEKAVDMVKAKQEAEVNQVKLAEYQSGVPEPTYRVNGELLKSPEEVVAKIKELRDKGVSDESIEVDIRNDVEGAEKVYKEFEKPVEAKDMAGEPIGKEATSTKDMAGIPEGRETTSGGNKIEIISKSDPDEYDYSNYEVSISNRIPPKSESNIAKAKLKEYGVSVIGRDASVTKESNLEGLYNDGGDFQVGVKDVNGNRANMPYSVFREMNKGEEFSDRIREVYIYNGEVTPKLKVQEGFMGDVFTSMGEISDRAVDINELKSKIAPIKELIEFKTRPLVKNLGKITEALSNPKIQEKIKQFGMKIVFSEPYKFELSEQGNISKQRNSIEVNVDAENPAQTILHELGHLQWDELTKAEKQLLKSKVVSKGGSYPQDIEHHIIDNLLQGENYIDNLKSKGKEATSTKDMAGEPEGREATSEESILNQDTDLKGNEKEQWMIIPNKKYYIRIKKRGGSLDSDKFQNPIGEGIPIGKDRYLTIEDTSENRAEAKRQKATKTNKPIQQFFYSEFYENAIFRNDYQKAISEGRMTANDAKIIIESAGLEVPKDILDMASEPVGKPATSVKKGGKNVSITEGEIPKSDQPEHPQVGEGRPSGEAGGGDRIQSGGEVKGEVEAQVGKQATSVAEPKETMSESEIVERGDKVKFTLGGREYIFPSDVITQLPDGRITFDLFGQKILKPGEFEVVKGEKLLPFIESPVTPSEVKKKAAEASKADVPLKEQKKDLLGQIDEVINLVVGERKAEFEKAKGEGLSGLGGYIDEAKIQELKDVGVKVEEIDEYSVSYRTGEKTPTGKKVWQVTFDIEGDGIFKLKLDALADSRDIVQKNYPTVKEKDSRKVILLKKDKGGIDDKIAYAQEDQTLIDNYWEAVRVGDVKTADVFRETLIKRGVEIPPSPQKAVEGAMKGKEATSVSESIQDLQEKLARKEITIAEYDKRAEVIRKQPQAKVATSESRPGDFLRKAKFVQSAKDIDKLQSNPLGVPMAIWDGVVEAVAKAIDAGASVGRGIRTGLEKLKETDWYKALTKQQKADADATFIAYVNQEFQKSKPATPEEANAKYDNMKREEEAAQKSFVNKSAAAVKRMIPRIIFDVNYNAKRALDKGLIPEGVRAKDLFVALKNVSKGTAREVNKAKEGVFGSLGDALAGKDRILSRKEQALLGEVLNAQRTIELDDLYDKKNQLRLKHPGDLTKEDYEVKLDLWKNNTDGILERDFGIKGEYDFSRVEKAAEKFYDIVGEKLKEMFDNDLLTPEAYEKLSTEQRYYSPREFLDYIDSAPEGKGSLSGIRKLKEGSYDAIIKDPGLLIEHIIGRVNGKIARNKANIALSEFSQAVPENGIIKTAKPSGEYFDKVAEAEAKKEQGEESGFIQVDWEATPKGFEPIDFLVKGKVQRVFVEDWFKDEWDSVTVPEGFQLALNILGWVTLTKPLKMMATGYNPSFPLTNTPLDIFHIFFTTDAYSPELPVALVQMMKDIVVNSKSIIKRVDKFDDFIKRGGYTATLTGEGGVRFKAKTYSTRSEAGRFLKQSLSYPGETSEIATRIALYDRYVIDGLREFEKKGIKPTEEQISKLKDHAASMATQYLNFSDHGYLTQILDAMIPYFGAGVQVTRGAVRYARNNPKMFAYKVGQVMAISGILAAWNLGMFGGTEEEKKRRRRKYIDEVNNRNKANYWNFMTNMSVIDADGNDRIPYFKTPADNTLIFAKNIAEDLIIKTFFPEEKLQLLNEKRLFEAQGLLKNVGDLSNMPPAFGAITGYTGNWDNFYKQDIWRGADFGKDKSQEYRDNTPAIYKAAGKIPLPGGAKLSPVRTEYAVESVLTKSNPFYLAMENGLSVLAEWADPELAPVKQDLQKSTLENIKRTPFANRFMSITEPNVVKDKYKSIQQEENVKKEKHNKALDRSIAKWDFVETVKIITDSSNSLSEKGRLMMRFKDALKRKNVPPEVVNLSFLGSKARANAMYDLYLQHKYDPKKGDLISNSLFLGGIITDDFKTEVLKGDFSQEFKDFISKAKK